eukprot:857225-Rhodomonas_salina.5
MHVQPQPSFYTLPRLVENLDKIDSERLNEDRRCGAAHGDGERRARQVAGRERQGVGLVADRAEAAEDSARSCLGGRRIGSTILYLSLTDALRGPARPVSSLFPLLS